MKRIKLTALHKTSMLLTAIMTLLSVFSAMQLDPYKAEALSGSEFNAGRIIDDTMFYNSNSMDQALIQQFLNSKLLSCDTNGEKPHSSGQTRAQYGTSRGAPPPYICLKDYSQNIPGVTNSGSDLCKGSISGGWKLASQIIYDVANACGVSPKVLIVLLQKEQSLVTDDWPWPIQYRSATGYGCPDTAPCDAEFYGFFNQVYQAAKAYKRYQANPANYNYRAGRSNNILWKPNMGSFLNPNGTLTQYDSNGNGQIDTNDAVGCGYSQVYIENQATAGLYIYTPYRPNQAALDYLYTTGDACSAYGNRNFWRMYNDWFGSTLAGAYASQPVWQSVFTDSTKTTSLGWGATLLPGRSAHAVVQMRNMGSITWTRSGGIYDVMLGSVSPQDRQSLLCHSSWLSPCNRTVRLNEANVPPGQIGTFEFPITAPNQPGSYNESFGLVINGIGYFPGAHMTFPITVEPERNSAQPVWQSVFTDSTKTTSLGWGATLLPGRSAHAVVMMKNTGNIPWTRSGGGNDVMLGTALPQDRISNLCKATWLHPCNRTVQLKEATVLPGQTGTFEFDFTAPQQPGNYNEPFGLVVNGKGYFGSFMSFQIAVQAERNSAQPVWQQIYTDSTRTTSLGWNAVLNRNQSAHAVVIMKNTGNLSWTSSGGGNDAMLGTVLNQDRQSLFCSTSWLNPCNRTVRLKEASVAPGQFGTFEFAITAPNQPGTYNESFAPVVNGRGYFSSSSFMNFQFSVQ